MTYIHCNKFPRLPGGGVYCRLCALAFRKQRDALIGLPWWQWPAYGPVPWKKYLTAVCAELAEPAGERALRSRPSAAIRLPPAAIRVVQQDILRSSCRNPDGLA